jgi:hypothetical protein
MKLKHYIITVVATIVITTSFIAASTYIWLQTLPKVYSCTKITTI